MHPVVLSFADGTSFFVGLVLVLVAELLLLRFRNRFARPVLTVLALVGMIFVVISATPLPVWAHVVWTIAALAALVLLNRKAAHSWQGRGAAARGGACGQGFATAQGQRVASTLGLLGEDAPLGPGNRKPRSGLLGRHHVLIGEVA